MRFMVIVKASSDSESGRMPVRAELDTMGRFNEEMAAAGIMLAAEGLLASARGARISFGRAGKRTVTDGPFAETKELVAGFWIIQVRSKDEAIEWMKRAPFPEGAELEVRQVSEAEDFGDAFTPEAREREERLRDQLAKK